MGFIRRGGPLGSRYGGGGPFTGRTFLRGLCRFAVPTGVRLILCVSGQLDGGIRPAMGAEICIAVELARLEGLAVVLGHQLCHRHQLIPLLLEPGHQHGDGLGGTLIGAVEQDDFAV